MNKENICLYCRIFIENKNILESCLKSLYQNGIMFGLKFYTDENMKKVLNNTDMIYDGLLHNKSIDIFISENNLSAHLKIDTDLSLKLIPIPAKNNLDDLAEYLKILLALTDNFAIEEFNTLGKAVNDEIFI